MINKSIYIPRRIAFKGISTFSTIIHNKTTFSPQT